MKNGMKKYDVDEEDWSRKDLNLKKVKVKIMMTSIKDTKPEAMKGDRKKSSPNKKKE